MDATLDEFVQAIPRPEQLLSFHPTPIDATQFESEYKSVSDKDTWCADKLTSTIDSYLNLSREVGRLSQVVMSTRDRLPWQIREGVEGKRHWNQWRELEDADYARESTQKRQDLDEIERVCGLTSGDVTSAERDLDDEVNDFRIELSDTSNVLRALDYSRKPPNRDDYKESENQEVWCSEELGRLTNYWNDKTKQLRDQLKPGFSGWLTLLDMEKPALVTRTTWEREVVPVQERAARTLENIKARLRKVQGRQNEDLRELRDICGLSLAERAAKKVADWQWTVSEAAREKKVGQEQAKKKRKDPVPFLPSRLEVEDVGSPIAPLSTWKGSRFIPKSLKTDPLASLMFY